MKKLTAPIIGLHFMSNNSVVIDTELSLNESKLTVSANMAQNNKCQSLLMSSMTKCWVRSFQQCINFVSPWKYMTPEKKLICCPWMNVFGKMKS